MAKQKAKSSSHFAPKHTMEVERVAQEIWWWSVGAAIVCTLVVMLL